MARCGLHPCNATTKGEPMDNLSKQKQRADNAAIDVTMLLTSIRRELDADNGPGYADAHPDVVAMCMRTAAVLVVADAVRELDLTGLGAVFE